jgi:hypothetical protein
VISSASGKEILKSLFPGSDCIQQNQSHGGAFIAKATVFQLDLIQIAGQFPLVRGAQTRMVAAKKCLADSLQVILHRQPGTIEPSTRELSFSWMNLQQWIEKSGHERFKMASQ